MGRTQYRCRYLALHPVCEQCGSKDGVEVHHKVPLSLGGVDEMDNYISLCFNCHLKAHKHNRSECTKAGLKNIRNKKYFKYVKVLWVLNEIYERTSAGDAVDANDVLDIIENAPYVKVREDKEYKEFEKENLKLQKACEKLKAV